MIMRSDGHIINILYTINFFLKADFSFGIFTQGVNNESNYDDINLEYILIIYHFEMDFSSSYREVEGHDIRKRCFICLSAGKQL